MKQEEDGAAVWEAVLSTIKRARPELVSYPSEEARAFYKKGVADLRKSLTKRAKAAMNEET